MSPICQGSGLPVISPDTPFYAKQNFIQYQRIVAIALEAIGCVSLALVPLTGGVGLCISTLCFAGSGVLIGTSLLQQVIGNTPGCEKGQIKRILAAACFMISPLNVVALLVGMVFWHFSNEDNAKLDALVRYIEKR